MVLRVDRPTIELWNALAGWLAEPSTIALRSSRNARGRNGIAAH